jgi:hypothetical protein
LARSQAERFAEVAIELRRVLVAVVKSDLRNVLARVRQLLDRPTQPKQAAPLSIPGAGVPLE